MPAGRLQRIPRDIEYGDYLPALLKKYKLDKAPLDFANQFYDRYVQAIAIADELPGVTSFLQQAKTRDLKLSVVTSSRKAWVETLLIAHDWYDLFNISVCEEDVRKCKPDPEPYLVAIDKLKIDTKHCVAFENRENGILSGKAAGVYVIGLLAGNEIAQNLKQADTIIQSFSGIDFADTK